MIVEELATQDINPFTCIGSHKWHGAKFHQNTRFIMWGGKGNDWEGGGEVVAGKDVGAMGELFGVG